MNRRRVHPRPLAFAGAGHVQHGEVVGRQPVPERRRFDPFFQRHDQAGFADLAGVVGGQRRAAVRRALVRDQRPVGVRAAATGLSRPAGYATRLLVTRERSMPAGLPNGFGGFGMRHPPLQGFDAMDRQHPLFQLLDKRGDQGLHIRRIGVAP